MPVNLALIRTVFLALMILPLAIGQLHAATAANDNDLARVGIANFTNLNQNPDYDWVEKSLPDAIDTSMKARFEFVRQDESKVNAAVEQFRGDQLTGKSQKAAMIAMQSQSDILIFGEYTVDAEHSQLTLKARVYNAAGKRFIGEIEEHSEINNKIFKNIDQMAAEIVSIIYQYALQANRGSSFQNLRLLVLVPTYKSDGERLQAEAELISMKKELSQKTPGTYVTLFEFFQQYHVAPEEQKHALDLATKRNQQSMKVWLENFGITDALVVFVSDNKVNITAISPDKTAQISYAVGAAPEEREAALKAAEVKAPEKKFIPTRANIYFGGLASKGMLDSGDKLGVITGASLQAGYRLWRFFEPQLRLDGYYGTKQQSIDKMLAYSANAGFAIPFDIMRVAGRASRMVIAPYFMGGIFEAQITTTNGAFRVFLPSAIVGLNVSYFYSDRWGLTLGASGQYIVDQSSPAAFVSGTLATVVRF